MVTRRPYLLQLEPEARQPFANEVVENAAVLLGGLLVEGRRVVVPQLRQLVGPSLDEVEEIAVPLLGLVARRLVVGPQGRLDVADQAGVLGGEEIELTLDEIDEAPAHACLCCRRREPARPHVEPLSRAYLSEVGAHVPRAHGPAHQPRRARRGRAPGGAALGARPARAVERNAGALGHHRAELPRAGRALR